MTTTTKKIFAIAIIAACTATSAQCSKKDDLVVQQAVESSSNAAKDGERCTSHQMCEPGAVCVQDKCKRIDKISCQSDLDCPEFDRCYEGKCAECMSDDHCGPGFSCNAHGVCVPSDPMVLHCDSAADCGRGQICLNGLCAFLCANHYDCLALNDERNTYCGSKNDFLVGICSELDVRLSAYCTEDSCSYHCGKGFASLNGMCYPMKCNQNDQCEDGKVCIDSRCRNCTQDAQCGDDRICNHNRCRKYECESDADCGDENKCHQHRCMECLEDADCDENTKCLKYKTGNNLLCNDETCTYEEIEQSEKLVCLECTEDSYCPKEKPYCDLDRNICTQCLGSVHCPKGYECTEDMCQENADMDNHERPRMKMTSNRCTASEECEAGKICLFGSCTSDRKRHFCSDNSACPEGSVCNTFYGECVIPAEKTSTDYLLDIMLRPVSSALYTSKISKDCMHNSDCHVGHACHYLYMCGCVSDKSCGPHQVCNENLKCECASDEGCAPGFFCTEVKDLFSKREHMCLCSNDEVCGDGMFCDRAGKCKDENDAVELYYHAMDYHYGYIHPVSLDKAVKYYTKSEKLGNPLAAIQLALIEYDTSKDDKIADAKIKDAIKVIDAAKVKAQNARKNGTDIKDLEPEVVVLSILAHTNHLRYLMAMLKIRGLGMHKDVKGGMQELEGFSRSFPLARYELADRYINGRDVAKDINKAKSIIMDDDHTYNTNEESAYGFYQIASLGVRHPELFSDLKPSSQFDIIISSLSDAAEIGHLDAKYQLSAFAKVNRYNSSYADYLSYAAKQGHKKAAQRLELVKSFQDLDSLSDANLKKQALKGDAAACDRLRKKHDAKDCAKTLTKQGLFVGDYIKHLSLYDNDDN